MSNDDWIIQRENGIFTIKPKPDASKEAQESYEHYLEQKKRDIS